MRKVAVGVFLLLSAVAAAWTALWFYAANEAARQLDAWLSTEQARGRTWTCPNRAIGGYPFAIAVSCSTPGFAGRALGQTVRVTVAGLKAEAAIYHPRSLSITPQSPLIYKTSDGQADLTATWSNLTFDVGGLPEVDTFALRGADLAVDGTFGEMGRQGGKAALIDANFDIDRQTADPTLAFKIDVEGAPVPPLDDLLGGQVPANIKLAGRLDKADAGGGRTPADVIERWRQAGGTITLADSQISRGESNVTGGGTIALDEAHRPQGRIDASFVGLEPALRRYGISGDLAAAGSLLSSLFGGGDRRPKPQASPGTLNLPVTFQNGRLGVGPIRTPIEVPPLY